MSTPPKMDVWILAGQSNMQGCGLLCDPTTCDACASDERVWSFTTAGNWEIASEPLHRLWESFTPVHQNFMRSNLAEADKDLTNEEIAAREASTRVTGAGLGISFAQAMADATGNSIGLIPAAHGGTSLEDWNFNRKDQGGASLYGAMLERIQKARLGADFQIKGVLWYQGESDCTQDSAHTYEERMVAWIKALREDLNDSELPFIAVQIGRVLVSEADAAAGWQPQYWEQVREALRVLPQRVEHCAVTSAVDLGLVDPIHIDTPGLIRLGERMAKIAQDLSAAPRVLGIEKGEASPLGFGTARVLCEGVNGGWNPKTNITGFEVRNAENQKHTRVFVIAANADTRDPKTINVIFNAPLDESIHLGYGLGLDPKCNAVDDNDQPLPAFSAQKISQ